MNNDHNKIVGVVILVLVLLATYLKAKYELDHNYVLFGVLIFGAILYSSEKLAKGFAKWWMKLGKFLGDINSRIILTILFLVILSPVALLRRLLTKKSEQGNSNWEEVGSEKIDFTKPW